MGFLFDTQKGNELSDGDITPNGFRLDNANNRNIQFRVCRRDISANGKQLDVRFDKLVSNNEKFTDNGVYEIKISSRTLPDAYITKTIFVGTDDIVKKYQLLLNSSTTVSGMLQDEKPQISTTTVSKTSTSKSTTIPKSSTTTRTSSTEKSSKSSTQSRTTTTSNSHTTAKSTSRPQTRTTAKT